MYVRVSLPPHLTYQLYYYNWLSGRDSRHIINELLFQIYLLTIVPILILIVFSVFKNRNYNVRRYILYFWLVYYLPLDIKVGIKHSKY